MDIDWDFFASTAAPADTIKDRVDTFLAKDFSIIPSQVYVCYSPNFSHPSRIQFQQFVGDLAQIFEAKVVELQPSRIRPAGNTFYRKYLPLSLFQLARRIYYKANLGLRKLGIY